MHMQTNANTCTVYVYMRVLPHTYVPSFWLFCGEEGSVDNTVA